MAKELHGVAKKCKGLHGSEGLRHSSAGKATAMSSRESNGDEKPRSAKAKYGIEKR